MKTAAFGICMWLCATVCSAASPFDGKWTGPFMRPAPAGNQDVTLTLTIDQGGRATGSATLQGVTGDIPIEWGYVKDDLIVVKIKAPFQQGTAVFVYMGKLTGAQIEFGRRPEDLSVGLLVKGTLKRAK